MPFMHMHIDTGGMSKACCVSNINYGPVKDKNIESIWYGERINSLRESFLNGESHKGCKNCYDKEAGGSESLRTETLSKYGNDINKYIKEPELVYLDIRFSNICNLKCRTCWHGSSSKWFEDAKKLNRAIADKAKIKAFDTLTELESQLGPYFKNAVEFYFAGGEPLLMEEHLFVVDQLLKAENFSCLLRYNTNLTSFHQFDKNLLDYWEQFDRVEVLASIEALGDKGEIIRSGMDVEVFKKNLKKLQTLKNVHVKIAPTLSILNFREITELHKTLFEEGLIGINDVHFNILHQPYFYNVQALPLKQKEEAKASFESHIAWIRANQGISTDWENTITFMFEADLSNKYQKALQENQLLNDLRGENLQLDKFESLL